MKKVTVLLIALILSVGFVPVYAADESSPILEITLEEKVAALKAVNGGDYSASDKSMTMAELVNMLINAYGLDEQYVKASGDGMPETPAFFDMGSGGPSMTLMRGNLAYIITKLYNLSVIPIDNPGAWKHIGQTGYSEVDGSEHGYPGNKEAIWICKNLGISIPQISDTDLGFEEPITKAEFAVACYSALRVSSDVLLEEKVSILNALHGNYYEASNKEMNESALYELLINGFGLDEKYVKGNGDWDSSTDKAFIDVEMPPDASWGLDRDWLPYVILKAYKLVDIDDLVWNKPLEESGYTDVDGVEGPQFTKQAIAVGIRLGLDLPENSPTEYGFGQNAKVTYAEFAAASYSALTLQKENLTRGQTFAMMCGAFGIEPRGEGDNFAGVEASKYKDYFAAAKQLDLAPYAENITFEADASITVQELYTLAFRALDVQKRLPRKATEAKKLSDYSDVSQINDWALEAVTCFAESDMLIDFDGEIKPNETVTGEIMARVFKNILTR